MSSEAQQRLLNAIVDAATAAGREAMASIGLDERALSQAMLIAGNALCLMAQSRLEAAGIATMRSTRQCSKVERPPRRRPFIAAGDKSPNVSGEVSHSGKVFGRDARVRSGV